MSQAVRIGLAQVTSEPFEVEKNRRLCVESAKAAFGRGADIVVLPEMIVHGYVAERERLAPLAETVEGPTVGEWISLAAEHAGYIVGGLCERDGDSLYNTAVMVDADGVLIHYRKLHLFAKEKHTFQQGDLGLPVAQTRFGTVGICVCYDLRFVEVTRALALKGADLICVPTAWVPGFDAESWDAEGMCPQARGALLQANLSQTFIACASQVGRRGEIEFLGSSIVADPYGHAVAGPLSGSEDDIVVVEVDMEAAKRAQVRSELIAPRTDRRTDVYGVVVDGEVY